MQLILSIVALLVILALSLFFIKLMAKAVNK